MSSINLSRHAGPVAWRYRNEFGEVVSEWIDGPPPEYVQDVKTCEVIATKTLKIDLAFSAPPATDAVREALERAFLLVADKAAAAGRAAARINVFGPLCEAHEAFETDMRRIARQVSHGEEIHDTNGLTWLAASEATKSDRGGSQDLTVVPNAREARTELSPSDPIPSVENADEVKKLARDWRTVEEQISTAQGSDLLALLRDYLVITSEPGNDLAPLYIARINTILSTGTDHVATVTYTNWRGETSVRRIIPKSVRFGSTEWHPEPQWLLLAWDGDKQADREFALKDFGVRLPDRDTAAGKAFDMLCDKDVVKYRDCVAVIDALFVLWTGQPTKGAGAR